MYPHKRVLKILIGPQTVVGLNPSLTVTPLLKSFNVIYFQTSDTQPNFLVIVGKDFGTETLGGKIYERHNRSQLV